MGIADRILVGLIDAILVLSIAGIILGVIEAPKQFEIGRKFGRDRSRSEKERRES